MFSARTTSCWRRRPASGGSGPRSSTAASKRRGTRRAAAAAAARSRTRRARCRCGRGLGAVRRGCCLALDAAVAAGMLHRAAGALEVPLSLLQLLATGGTVRWLGRRPLLLLARPIAVTRLSLLLSQSAAAPPLINWCRRSCLGRRSWRMPAWKTRRRRGAGAAPPPPPARAARAAPAPATSRRAASRTTRCGAGAGWLGVVGLHQRTRAVQRRLQASGAVGGCSAAGGAQEMAGNSRPSQPAVPAAPAANPVHPMSPPLCPPV